MFGKVTCSVVTLMSMMGPLPAQEIEEIRIEVGSMTFDAYAAGPADGELVLLLHGFPQAGFAYRAQLPELARAGFRAVAPNQRGYSPDARPTEVAEYGMSYLVGDVLGMASALGYERFHLVGHDWGAAVAWVVAASAPARIQSLVALSTPHVTAFGRALADPESEQSQASSYMDGFRAEGSERRFLANDGAEFKAMLASFALSGAYVEEYLEILGTEEALGAALNWYRAGFSPPPPGSPPPPPGPPAIVTVPTLYVFGSADSAFSLETAEASAEFVTGPYRFEVLEGVSHWIAEQAPDELNALLAEHFAEWRGR